MLKWAIVAVVLCTGLGADLASAAAQGLLPGAPAGDVGALPSRARKSASPDIQTPLAFEALRQETYPGLRASVLVEESVVRLVGKGFGSEAGGRDVVLTVSTQKEPLVLSVLSWRDTEIRVQIPALSALGVDAKLAAQMKTELTQRKHVVGPQVAIFLRGVDGSEVVKPRTAQLAVVYRDLDNDGSDTDDCDDFDARRTPGRREVTDPEGLDEDCNPETHGEPALATLDEPTL